MTNEQLQDCLQCLNRNRGIVAKENICNLKGKNLDFENTCIDFDQDKSKISTNGLIIEKVKPNTERAKIAQVLIWCVMGISILSIGSSYLQLNLLQAVQNEEFVTDQMLSTNDMREQILAMIYLIVYIISIVTFIQWFRRAYYNMNIRTNCSHSESWAAGSWFVPVISLYRPYKIMKEMWEEATRIIKAKSETYISNENTILIGGWWALWIFSNYIGKYAAKSAFKADTVEALTQSTIGEMINSTFDIPLAIITVMMIKQYADKEAKLFDLEKRENLIPKTAPHICPPK